MRQKRLVRSGLNAYANTSSSLINLQSMKSNYNRVLQESPTWLTLVLPLVDIPKINTIGVDQRQLMEMTEYKGLLSDKFMYKGIFWSIVVGYIMGKGIGRSAIGMTIGFSSFILFRYAIDSTMKKRGILQDKLITKTTVQATKRTPRQPTTITPSVIQSYRAKNIKFIQLKTESIDDLVDNLPLSYFQ